MSNKITENAIEEFAIKLLEHLGYQYIYAPDIAPNLPVRGTQTGTDRAESACADHADRRASYEDVLLTERLQNAIRRINPNISTR